ncbi:response regulator transcription factor [Bradyrhizobium canariense]|uniref:DNA-binding response regulator, NarL/FixJ family, contains REC and HTH domains n=1 Tax=Bradyrhizobium canariense TaxID=255045 RepID=A0A1H1ZW51_9BRAD|nr:response regulator transcription factor [Bradyrhizobium canariense]SDT37883.1 DNA-binding response regulator, NarL/FixJ family, contains REC and HTH domains [Bradyrhizobium canariense]
MQKPDPYLVRATTHSLENELSQSQPTFGLREPSNAPLYQQGPVAKPSDRRLMLISRPGLVSDCLNNALNECGYDTVFHAMSDPLRAPVEGANLVVISMNSSEPDGLTALRKRAHELRDCMPGVPAMALIEHSGHELPRELADVGLVAIVQGYLSVKLALAAINLVLVGGSLMTTKIFLQTDQVTPPRHNAPIETTDVSDDLDFSAIGNFTKREIALLTHLRQGMQNKAIAYELGIAESTVKVHLRNIMSKLHASNRTQVAYMLANGSLANPQKATVHKLEPITISGNVSELFSAAVDAKVKTTSSRHLES